jgi:hypothetical protein
MQFLRGQCSREARLRILRLPFRETPMRRLRLAAGGSIFARRHHVQNRLAVTFICCSIDPRRE